MTSFNLELNEHNLVGFSEGELRFTGDSTRHGKLQQTNNVIHSDNKVVNNINKETDIVGFSEGELRFTGNSIRHVTTKLC